MRLRYREDRFRLAIEDLNKGTQMKGRDTES